MRFFGRRGEARSLTVKPALFPGQPSSLGAIPLPAAALSIPDVFACVRTLTDAAASCPLIAYRRLGDGERKRATGRTTDLLRAPAEGTTQAGLISTVVAHLLLHGNAYLGKYRDPDGRVEQLLPIAPDRVTVERRAGRIVFTIVDAMGRPAEHGLDDIVHVKGLSTDGLVGLSPIRQMRLALDTSAAVRSASTALFQNGARPSGILRVPGASNREAVDALKDSWTHSHGGERAGGIAILSGDVEFSAISMPADDAEFVAARKLSATEIARCFRIPAWMISAEDGGSMTYSNSEQQGLAFVSYGLRPWLVAIEQALAADTDLFSSSTFCEFLIDGLLRADSMTRAQVYEKALNPTTGWLRRDEVRRLENLEPEPADLASVPPPVPAPVSRSREVEAPDVHVHVAPAQRPVGAKAVRGPDGAVSLSYEYAEPEAVSEYRFETLADPSMNGASR